MSSLLSTLLVISVVLVLVSTSDHQKKTLEQTKKFSSYNPYLLENIIKENIFSSFDDFDLRDSLINQWKSNRHCYDVETIYEKSSRHVCSLTAVQISGVNETCKYSTYYKYVVDSSSPISDDTNGIVKCTQEECGSWSPTEIDCLEALGQERLTEIEKTPETDEPKPRFPKFFRRIFNKPVIA